ncbi:MAG: hypothetical protein NW703_00405 [Nitrospiraceae bacterium]
MTPRSIIPSTLVTSCLLWLGCATTPDIDFMIHEAPKGAVYLERNPDRSFQAAHPVRIDPELITRALQGVIVRDESTTMQKVFRKISPGLRAFSDDDIRFLAPDISSALAQAAPDQQVGFRVHNYPATLSYAGRGGAEVGSSEPPLTESTLLETTSGHLSVSDGSLRLTVSRYRKRAERADSINMANRRVPDSSGLGDKILAFVPDAALKPDHQKRHRLFGATPDTTFVIDYEMLATLSDTDGSAVDGTTTAGGSAPDRAGEPRTQGQPTAADEQELRQIRTDLNKKNEEIDALKKEVESIRQELKQPTSRPRD